MRFPVRFLMRFLIIEFDEVSSIEHRTEGQGLSKRRER